MAQTAMAMQSFGEIDMVEITIMMMVMRIMIKIMVTK